jgi:cytochrome b involved in lipid metabolism
MATKYSRAQVATHNKPEDLSIIISGQVYNITEFQEKHPGGKKSEPCSPLISFGFRPKDG